MPGVRVEDRIEDDECAFVLTCGCEEDGAGELVDVMFWIERVCGRLGLVGPPVEVVLDLLTAEALVPGIVEDELGSGARAVERHGGQECAQRDGLCGLVGFEHLDALGSYLYRLVDATFDEELGREASPVLGRDARSERPRGRPAHPLREEAGRGRARWTR